MVPRINTVHVVLQGIVVVTLLLFGVYGIVWTQTSPSDQANIINAVVRGEYTTASTGVTNGGTAIKPAEGAQYILMFKPADQISSSQGPSILVLPSGGFVFGPLAWAPPSTSSSYKKVYALFTDSFSFQPGPSGCCPLWFSGPQGNVTPSMSIGRYGGLENYAGPAGGFGWATPIFEVDAPGNYTLHFINSGAVGNVTARVSMGRSLVTFSSTQPYLYVGIAATGFAIIFSAVTALAMRKKPVSTGSRT